MHTDSHMTRRPAAIVLAVAALALAACAASRPAPAPVDPLPTWNDGPSKDTIVEFVERVTDSENPDFVPSAERIAVFDNDGTLWSEQPAYFQLLFALDRIRAMAPQHPEWLEQQPYKAVLENDMETLLGMGESGLLEVVMTTHAGMSAAEFRQAAEEWVATATHPRTGKPYISMVYQPMLELLDYLRDKDFQTWIVSGGGIDFMRPWTEQVYGIPPQQVVGSSVVTRFVMGDDGPMIMREAELSFFDDKEGKPVAIHHHIGRQPVIAFGNSDGDLQMLQWTAARNGPSLLAYIHHTDDEREWAYDRDSHIGRLDRGLDEARERGWLVVDMQRDWRVIWPFKLQD